MPGPNSEAAPYEGLWSGDRDAFSHFYGTEHPRLLRFLSSRLSRDVEDVAAETWLSFVTAMSSVSDRHRDPRPLLFTIARRRYQDWCRQNLKAHLSSIDEDRADGTRMLQVDEQTTRVDGEMEALALLRTLPDHYAEVLVLRMIADFSVRETASILGRSEGSVKLLTYRALELLRTELTVDRPGSGTKEEL